MCQTSGGKFDQILGKNPGMPTIFWRSFNDMLMSDQSRLGMFDIALQSSIIVENGGGSRFNFCN